MPSLVPKVRVGSILLACVGVVLFAGLAWSDVVVQRPAGGPGAVRFTVTWSLAGEVNAPFVRALPPAAGGGLCDSPPKAFGAIPGPRIYFTPCTNGSYGCIALGGAAAGGRDANGQLSTKDTLFASVGIYSLGGTSPDTSLALQVTRVGDGPGGVQDKIQLTWGGDVGGVFVPGGAALQSSLRREGGRAGLIDYKVFVYPDTTTANLDPNRTGAGAVPGGIGRAFFRQNILNPTGMFSSADWTPPRGYTVAGTRAVYTTRFAGGMKEVNVDDKDAAAVVEFADPEAADALPGHSPLSLALLSLALLGSGIWLVRLRARTAMA